MKVEMVIIILCNSEPNTEEDNNLHRNHGNSQNISDHVDWGTTIDKTSAGEFATKSTLYVTNSVVDDTGLYQCFAYNDHQTAMTSASVFISCKFFIFHFFALEFSKL